MNRLAHALLLAVVLALTLLGCNSRKAAGLMPSPPAGWKAQGEPIEEAVAGAGLRAVATFVPADDAALQKGVTKVEVHYAVVAQGTKDDGSLPPLEAPSSATSAPGDIQAQFSRPFLKELRKHPANKADMLILKTVAGHPVLESPPYSQEVHLLTMRAAANVVVDVVAYGPKDAPWVDAVEAFAAKIDFEKVKGLTP